jgi:hypothetical protein
MGREPLNIPKLFNSIPMGREPLNIPKLFESIPMDREPLNIPKLFKSIPMGREPLNIPKLLAGWETREARGVSRQCIQDHAKVKSEYSTILTEIACDQIFYPATQG